MDEKIEYETVTLRVPKRIMAFLRKQKKNLLERHGGPTVEEYLEYAIVDFVHADIDAEVFNETPKILADRFDLNPVFKDIIGFEVL